MGRPDRMLVCLRPCCLETLRTIAGICGAHPEDLPGISVPAAATGEPPACLETPAVEGWMRLLAELSDDVREGCADALGVEVRRHEGGGLGEVWRLLHRACVHPARVRAGDPTWARAFLERPHGSPGDAARTLVREHGDDVSRVVAVLEAVAGARPGWGVDLAVAYVEEIRRRGGRPFAVLRGELLVRGAVTALLSSAPVRPDARAAAGWLRSL